MPCRWELLHVDPDLGGTERIRVFGYSPDFRIDSSKGCWPRSRDCILPLLAEYAHPDREQELRYAAPNTRILPLSSPGTQFAFLVKRKF